MIWLVKHSHYTVTSITSLIITTLTIHPTSLLQPSFFRSSFTTFLFLESYPPLTSRTLRTYCTACHADTDVTDFLTPGFSLCFSFFSSKFSSVFFELFLSHDPVSAHSSFIHSFIHSFLYCQQMSKRIRHYI